VATAVSRKTKNGWLKGDGGCAGPTRGSPSGIGDGSEAEKTVGEFAIGFCGEKTGGPSTDRAELLGSETGEAKESKKKVDKAQGE